MIDDLSILYTNIESVASPDVHGGRQQRHFTNTMEIAILLAIAPFRVHTPGRQAGRPRACVFSVDIHTQLGSRQQQLEPA